MPPQGVIILCDSNTRRMGEGPLILALCLIMRFNSFQALGFC